MICPRCGGQNISVVPVTELKNKTRWCCGCFVTWIAFLLPKRKTKTHTEAVCQNCGARWKVHRSTVKHNAAIAQANTYVPQYVPIAPCAPTATLPPQANAVAPAPFADSDQTCAPRKPFYKETWFMVLCGWWFWLIEVAIWLFAKPAHVAYMFIKSKIKVDAEPFDIDTAGYSEAVEKAQAFSIYPSQFYKSNWFFILLCIFCPCIAILILFLKKRDWKMHVRVAIAAVLALWWILLSIASNGANTSSSAQVSSSDLSYPSATDISDSDSTL